MSLQVAQRSGAFGLTAITENAASVHDEASCLRLDVLEDGSNPTHYFYETDRDSEALGEYKAAPPLQRGAQRRGRVPGSQIDTFSDMVVSHSDESPA